MGREEQHRRRTASRWLTAGQTRTAAMTIRVDLEATRMMFAAHRRQDAVASA